MECKQMCGRCYGNEQCHHVKGTCPNGCDAGVYEPYCKTGELVIKCFSGKKNTRFLWTFQLYQVSLIEFWKIAAKRDVCF